jgi:hypothetical protein
MSNEKKTLIDRLLVVLKLQKEDPKLAEDIKKLSVQFNAEPAAAAAAPAAPAAKKEVKTADGKSFTYEGETLQIGTKIFEGENPLADGSYTLEDGSMIMVTGGLVTDIKPVDAQASAAPAAPAATPAPAYLSKEDAEVLFDTKMKAQVDSLTARLAALEEAAKVTTKFITDVLGASIPDKQAMTKNPAEMTALERHRYYKEIQ